MPESLRRLLRAPRTRRVAPALGAIAAVAVAIGVLVGAGSPGTSRGATTAAGGNGSGSALVERRDLIATDTESGTLGYADPRTVFNRVSGTITGLPQVGSTIRPGGTLYTVDGAPVILFDGTTPAYRAFTSGMSDGPDVAELKRNLVALGFDPGHAITVSDTFDAATVAAIDRWQGALGRTQTGTIPLGEIVFLPGPRRVASVSAQLGSTGGGGGGGGGTAAGATGAAYVPGTVRAQFIDLTSTAPAPAAEPASGKPATRTTTTTTPPRAGVTPRRPAGPNRPGAGSSPTAQQLLAELVAELRRASGAPSASSRSPASSTRASSAGASARSPAASSGSAAGSSSAGAGTAATAIMTTTSADLVVTVQLDATKQSEAVIGEHVTVQLPDGSTTSGRVTAVSSVAQSASSSSSGSAGGGGGGAGSSAPSATVPVTIALTGRHRVQGLDQAAVSVNFAQSEERGVLAVPVTALLATQGGGYALQTTGQNPRLIAVTPGLFAGGYVQVSGQGLYEGLRVSDSQG